MDRRFWSWAIIAKVLLGICVCWPVAGCGRKQEPVVESGVKSTVEQVNEFKSTELTTTSPNDDSAKLSQPDQQVNGDPESVVIRGDSTAAAEQAIRSSSPIDQIPEGKLYRQALEAIDRGKPEFALKAKAELASHPIYGVLGNAVDVLLLATEGRYDDAMKAAESVSTVQVMQADSYMLAADVFRMQGRFREAIDCLQSSLQLNNGNARAQRWLGIIFYDIGAMQQATIHLRQAASIDKLDVGSLRLSSKIFFEYQNFFEAAEDCRNGLARQPTPEIAEELRLRLADSLRELRKFDEAFSVLEQCQQSADAFVSKARIYESQGQASDAMKACRRALELEPNERMGNLILGRLLLAERRFEEAIPALEIAAKAEAADHESRFLLGRCLLNAGKRIEGEQMVAMATELKQRFLEITELHRQAINEPQSAELRFKIGQLLEASNRPELARMWYRAALGLDSGHRAAAEAYSTLLPEN